MSKLPIRNRLILVCTALITAYVGLSAAGGVFLMENALHVQRRPLTEHANLYASVAKLTVVGVENASTFGADGALLKGEYVQPLIWNRDSVILLHGVGDNREGTAAYVPMFLRAGMQYCYQTRGHTGRVAVHWSPMASWNPKTCIAGLNGSISGNGNRLQIGEKDVSISSGSRWVQRLLYRQQPGPLGSVLLLRKRHSPLFAKLATNGSPKVPGLTFQRSASWHGRWWSLRFWRLGCATV